MLFLWRPTITEKIIFIIDCRAEAHEGNDYNRVQSPIVDDAEHQDESIKSQSIMS